jgi:hypothetical protein
MNTGSIGHGTNGQPGKIPDEVIQSRIARRDPNMLMKREGYKTVEISAQTRGRITEFTQDEFLSGYGMSDGEDYMALVKSLAASVPSIDRGDFLHTLHNIHHNEVARLKSFVLQLNPSWKYGEPFDREAVRSMIENSIDVRV